MIQYSYMHQGELLCSEWVDEQSPTYHLSLNMQRMFYYSSTGWSTEFTWDANRELELLLKFSKIRDGVYYYESSGVVKDDFLFE